MMRKRKTLFIILLFLFYFLLFFANFDIFQIFPHNIPDNSYGGLLPTNAQNICDKHIEIFPDYVYCRKADITEEEFIIYIDKLGREKYYAEKTFTDIGNPSWFISQESPECWGPTQDMTNTFTLQEGHNWTWAKYENGHTYLFSYSH
jgi:hypothetical protein